MIHVWDVTAILQIDAVVNLQLDAEDRMEAISLARKELLTARPEIKDAACIDVQIETLDAKERK